LVGGTILNHFSNFLIFLPFFWLVLIGRFDILFYPHDWFMWSPWLCYYRLFCIFNSLFKLQIFSLTGTFSSLLKQVAVMCVVCVEKDTCHIFNSFFAIF
jgi:hypothetical protein